MKISYDKSVKVTPSFVPGMMVYLVYLVTFGRVPLRYLEW